MNRLYYGDNLGILRRYVPDQSADLVYLDPPFNSNATYNVLFADKSGQKSAAQIQAFEDTWEWSQEESERTLFELVNEGDELAVLVKALRDALGSNDMMAYLVMMAVRLKELFRVLKSTGSIYLHCDPTASHSLKLVMDAVFGPQNFQSEIIWKRTNARSTTGRWPRIHDVILFYTKSDVFTFHSLKAKADKAKLPHTLITGSDGLKYQTYELTAPGETKEGDSGKPWRGFNPGKYGRHWANNHAQMDEWDAGGLIHWAKAGVAGGFPRRRDEEPFEAVNRQVTVGDIWTDIDRLNQTAKERLTYPTQKPEALLERIIRASSNEGDIVLDPFCGCGTTIAVAQRLNRPWVGIDITRLAITLVKYRLANAHGPAITEQYAVTGEPTTLDEAAALAADEPLHFQEWALGLVNARPTKVKKGADKGIDGRLFFQEGDGIEGIVMSVKGGKTDVRDVRDLRGVMEREKAVIGVLISLQSPTGPMEKEASEASFFRSKWGTFPRIQLLTIEGLLDKTHRLQCPPTNITFKKAPKAQYEQPEARKLWKAAEAPAEYGSDEEEPF